MKLTILGSGTCVPSVKRGSPANLLEIEDLKILLDMGPGSLRQLAKVDSTLYRNIDIVYFSHHHTDHIADFGPLVQAFNWTPGFSRKKDLFVIGHPALKRIISEILGKAMSFKIKFIPLIHRVKVKNIVFEVMNGDHSETSLVVKIRHNGRILVYTGDSEYNPKLVGFAKQCDVFMTENSFPGNVRNEGHTNAYNNARMANLIRPKSLLLTHLYPPADRYDIKKQIQRYYKGKIIVAKDLMKITI